MKSMDCEKTDTVSLMKRWQDLYLAKNKDYGSSWEKTGKILEILLDGKNINVSSVDDYNVLSLLIRILDKICRFTNIYFIAKQKTNINETLTETAGDAGTYFFMLASLINKEKNDLP